MRRLCTIMNEPTPCLFNTPPDACIMQGGQNKYKRVQKRPRGRWGRLYCLKKKIFSHTHVRLSSDLPRGEKEVHHAKCKDKAGCGKEGGGTHSLVYIIYAAMD